MVCAVVSVDVHGRKMINLPVNAIVHFTVVYFVAKPLIWSEAEGDLLAYLACVAGLMFWYAVVCSLKSGEQESLDWRLYYFLSLQASKDTQICQLHRIMEFSKLCEHVS